MSKYRAYPEYKDSGVEWLGDVPEHWDLTPLKYLSRFSGGGTPSKDNPEYWTGDIPWVSPKDMRSPRITSTIDKVSEKAIKESSTNLLTEGALLMVVRSGVLQHSIPVAINDVPVTLNQDMKAFRFNARCSVQYAMQVIVGNQRLLLLEWSKQGATVESIEHEYLANTAFPVPPIFEQETITRFLDHETAKIDTLIEKQQQLIKLLKEKRQAVISHAVTKGLNPLAKMRDSGVEWLGEVPEHWGVGMISSLSNKITNGYVGPTRDIFHDDGVRYLQSLHIKNNKIEFHTPYYVSEEWSNGKEKSILKEGDVLVVQTGDIGQVAAVTKNYEGCNCHALIVISTNPELNGFYLSWLLNSDYGFHSLKSIQTGALHPHLNCGYVKMVKITLPPIKEQKKIVDYAEDANNKYDLLVEKVRNQIERLYERRTALISAAVTGKIDVRDWLAPEDARP